MLTILSFIREVEVGRPLRAVGPTCLQKATKTTSVYTFALWLCFVLLVTLGYMTLGIQAKLSGARFHAPEEEIV